MRGPAPIPSAPTSIPSMRELTPLALRKSLSPFEETATATTPSRIRRVPNPNHARDDFWEDGRCFPEDYFGASSEPAAVYATGQREQEETSRAERMEHMYTVRDALPAPPVFSPSWHRALMERRERRARIASRDAVVRSQFVKPNYTFRNGPFAGLDLDTVPEWYREELMAGGENGLVNRDCSLRKELEEAGYMPWGVRDGHSFHEKNADLLAGDVLPEIRDLGYAERMNREELSLELSLTVPAQPTQSCAPVPLSQHGLNTLPPLLRDTQQLESLPTVEEIRRQRDFYLGDGIDEITMHMARQGPTAGYKNATNDIDGDMMDRVNGACRF